MNSHSHRSIRLVLPVVAVAALLALCCSGIAAAGSAKTGLGGKWSGQYGGAFAGTFKLNWKLTGTKLSGSIALSNPKGGYSINGSVRGSKITFGAVGAGATYTGSVSGTSMSGTYKSPQGGGSWSATKQRAHA